VFLLVEALAQAEACLSWTVRRTGKNISTYFLKIDKLKFKHKVVPGDTVILKMELIEPFAQRESFQCMARHLSIITVVEGEMVHR